MQYEKITYDVLRSDAGLALVFPDREPIPLTPEEAWGLSMELAAMATLAKQSDFVKRKRDEINAVMPEATNVEN